MRLSLLNPAAPSPPPGFEEASSYRAEARESVCWDAWDTGQDICNVCNRINAILLTGFNQAVNNGSRLTPSNTPHKHIVFSPKNDSFYTALRSIVINFKPPILDIGIQGFPIGQGIRNGFPQ